MLILIILRILKFSDRVVYAAHAIEYIIVVYTNIFFLYLIQRFIKQSTSASVSVKDPILDRDVPNIVLLQNQKLVSEAVKDKLQSDQDRKDQLRLRAQMNDFMYKLLREEGLNAQLDEVIGGEFIDYNRTRTVVGTRITEASYRHSITSQDETQELLPSDGNLMTQNSMASEDRRSLLVQQRFVSYVNKFD